jgi:hypothetical protein
MDGEQAQRYPRMILYLLIVKLMYRKFSCTTEYDVLCVVVLLLHLSYIQFSALAV